MTFQVLFSRLFQEDNILLLPNNDSSCGWVNTLPPRQANPSLSEKKRVKWAIIGAGYSGLSAALTLSEHLPDDEIVVLEANKAGEGASARNSGYLVDSTLNDGHMSDTGLKAYKDKYALNLNAIEVVRAMVAKYGIDCDWSECGKYHAASNVDNEAKLKRFQALLEQLEIGSRFIEGKALTDKLGTDFYQMAVKTDGGIMLQPAAYARGLVAALGQNVSLYENTPVTKLSSTVPYQIDCPNGQVIADNLIIAVNGFMPGLGLKKDRVFPLLLTASMTRVLTEAEQAKMNHCEQWGVLSASPMGATVRYTQDKRIMIRNTVEVSSSLKMSAQTMAERRKVHLAGLKKRFDFLPEDCFEFSWSGVTCISYNNANVYEQPSKNCWLIGCYNGGGIGLATLFGQQAALAGDGQITTRAPANPESPQTHLVAASAVFEHWCRH